MADMIGMTRRTAMAIPLLFTASMGLGHAEENPQFTLGQVNGRCWKSLSRYEKSLLVIGLHDGAVVAVEVADDMENKPGVFKSLHNKTLERVTVPRATPREISEIIDALYVDASNSILPVSELYVIALKRWRGEPETEVSRALAYQRQLWSAMIEKQID